ncbi:hypothetical protein T484DRAFT_1776742 [Baffinella frigidus]|nr:hypothetical protein T484DRAFT_1776742 [Cryptophyta sp. CCMP2293]
MWHPRIGVLQDATSTGNGPPPVRLFGSFGALATLLYAAPASPFAQPRFVVGGHLIGCLSALLVDYFTNPAYDSAFMPQLMMLVDYFTNPTPVLRLMDF